MSRQIIVNAFYDDNGINTGIAVHEHTIRGNMEMMYEPNHLNNIFILFARAPEGAYLIERFCQYIVYIQFQPKIGLSMKVSDFSNNIDLALDHYSELLGKGWNKEDRDKIMRIVQEIADNPREIAEMVIKDEFPLTD